MFARRRVIGRGWGCPVGRAGCARVEYQLLRQSVLSGHFHVLVGIEEFLAPSRHAALHSGYPERSYVPVGCKAIAVRPDATVVTYATSYARAVL